MSTPIEVYDAVKAAIVGTSVTKAHVGDTLAHYEGPLEEMPLRDRTFVLQSAALDRVTERMGCQEWTLELDVAVVYQLTKGANARALIDAQAISDVVVGLIGQTGSTVVEELPTSIDISERFITTALGYLVSFSEGG